MRATALALTLAVAAACSIGDDSLDQVVEGIDGPTSTAATTAPPSETDPSGAPEPDPTPLPIDPELRLGTLDNGLTYYLRSNDSPGSNLEIRLVVDAGSLQDAEPGLGNAHFLEHMLFNGTERFPDNELDRVLRELGAEIGPDLNAFTSYDETVYFLSVTTQDPQAVETAFDVVADWAGAATIEPQAVINERGVVREELRERVETGEGFIVEEFDRVYTDGSAYEGFDPIGTVEGVETTEATELRDFYDGWYRPDNMAVVAVGDLSLDEMEALVTDRLGDLEARGPAPDRTEPELAPAADATFHIFTHPDQSSPYLSLDIPLRSWHGGTVGGERLALMENLIVEMLRNRFADAHTRGELAQDTAPLVELFSWTRTLRYLGTNLQADDLPSALTAFMAELLTVEVSGFDDDDLARAADSFEAGYEFLLDSVGSTQDADYADRYITHFLQGTDIGSADDTAGRGRQILDSLTPEVLTEHFRWMMQQGAPIVVAVGPDEASLPTAADLEAALAAVTPGERRGGGDTIEELMAPPDGVDPIAANPLPELGGIEWVFANGARVVFVESDISEGAVDLRAAADGGWSLLEPGDAPLASLAAAAVSLSGFGGHDRATVNRFLAGSTAWIQPYIDQTDEGFFGGSSTNDLATLFQLLHLGVTAPRVDNFSLVEAINQGANDIAAAATDPVLQTWLALNEARFGSDPWQVIVPTQAQLDGFTAEAALAMYQARLGDVDDLVVAVVGDVARDQVEAMAERYVGTLPAGSSDTYADVIPAAPEGVQTRRVVLDDDVTAAGLVIHHEVAVDVTPAVELTARVLENIINARLFRSIREELGASYGGTVSISAYTAPVDTLESIIDASGDPAQLDLIRTTVLATLAQLATEGPAGGELDEAAAVLGNDLGFTSNSDLLELLLRQAGGDDVPWQDVMYEELGRLDADAVRALAADLYPSDRRIEVIRTVG